ncbi:hypothetical protein BGX31_001564, partial [Mortierella sp. GBA43]
MLAHRSGPLMCFALTGGNLPYAAISTKVEVNLVESASLSVIERSHFDHFSVPYSNDQFTEIPKRSLLSDARSLGYVVVGVNEYYTSKKCPTYQSFVGQ